MRVAFGGVVKLVPGIGGSPPRPVELAASAARHVGGEVAGLARGVGSIIARRIGKVLGDGARGMLRDEDRSKRDR